MFFIESLRKLHALQVFVYLSRIEVVAVFLGRVAHVVEI